MAKELALIRDVLDKQLLDVHGQPAGKCDAIVGLWREGHPVELAYIEVSGVALARRIHSRLGRWAERLARRVSPTRGRPYRIPWSQVQEFGHALRVKIDADHTAARAWEHWLRDRIIGRIPGA